MEWSSYQKNIFDAVANSEDSLLVEACAGSGKSTTLLEAINCVPKDKSVLFCAFNRHIAENLKSKITARNAQCKTLHALGYKAWRDYLGGDAYTCKVDGGKTSAIIKEYCSVLERARYGEELRKLTGIVKGAGMVPKGLDLHGLVEDDEEVWADLISFYGLDPDGCSAEVTRKVLRHSIELSRDVIDYDDMLWLPIIHQSRFDKYDVIFLDEAQDVNAIQVEIVDRMRKPTSRVVAVGDRNQSIYLFRGCLTASMDNIAKRFHCRSLPLSVSYRCPKAVVRKAQEIVSHIQSHESAPEGLVVEYPPVWPLTNFRPTDAIVCRNTRPLITTAFLLIRNKISCRVLGRDIGEGLIKLIKKMKAYSIPELVGNLARYRRKEIEKARARDDEAKIAALDDKLETINVFIDEAGPTATVETLIGEIDALFSDTTGGRLTLSTVHKYKGLEAPRVFILDAHILMPNRYAHTEAQLEQEANLIYVAQTRAKEELYYISSEVLKVYETVGQHPNLEVAKPVLVEPVPTMTQAEARVKGTKLDPKDDGFVFDGEEK